MTKTNVPLKQPHNNDELRDWAFFSANLHKLMPNVSYAAHPAYYASAWRYRLQATNDDLNWKWLNELPAPNDFLNTLQQPGVIASFHTGPYRLLCMWLIRHGIPFTLVVSADVAHGQGESNDGWYRRIADNDKAGHMHCLLAEDPMVMRKMVRHIKQGRFILLYVDGNMGAGKMGNYKGSLTLDFLAHRIRVKTGVAELARLAKAPIYPVLAAFDDKGVPELVFRSPINTANLPAARKVFVAHVMKQLYDWLQSFLGKNGLQWEGWFYVHADLVRDTDAANHGFLRYYAPFEFAGKYFLLHKDSFMVYPISADVYQMIQNMCCNNVVFS